MVYKHIIEKMTLEEKASLMSGKDFWQSRDIPEYGIPNMFLADGPHGLRRQAAAADHLGFNPSIPATCFPTAASIANSWNEELGEEVGQALGDEAVSQKVNVLLGPGLNIKRNPLCGRNFEYFSEDPYLAGKMASAYVKGIQSRGISACLKHYCANNQEKNRMTIDTIVDERTLREIYLTGFEIAVKEGKPKTVMSSYNRLNGIYTNEHPHLLQDILRNEWGFGGVVVTDWGGGNDRVEGLKAGNELEMPTTGGETDRDIVKAVQTGELDESVLDNAVDRLLQLSFSTTEALACNSKEPFETDHHELARKAAEESIVLLKNADSILPLNAGSSIAVVGDFASTPRYQGAGSSIVNPSRLDSFVEEIQKSELDFAGFARGFDRYGKKNGKLLKDACKLASQADNIILFMGLDEFTEVEGLDRDNMRIPQNQIDLLNALASVNKNIIVVLSSGSAVEMPWLNKVKGLVHSYLCGQAGAGAVLNILCGKVNPSGKLAETYPHCYADTPSAPYFPGEEATVEYREALYIGYRYFVSTGKDVLFPFGFGLSYTEFTYSDLYIGNQEVSFTITNTGDLGGSEIAQLYVSHPGGDIFRPAKELKGFKKVYLEPGEKKQVSIPLDDKAFRHFNVKTGNWDIETGDWLISIGASCIDIRLSGMQTVEGSSASVLYEKEKLSSYFSASVASVPQDEFELLLGRKAPDPKWDRNKVLGYNDTIAQCRYSKGLFARFAYHLIVFAHFILRKIGKRDLSNLIMMSVYYMPFRGISRMTGGVINMPMLDGVLLMANGRFFRGLGKLMKEHRINRRSSKGISKANNPSDIN